MTQSDQHQAWETLQLLVTMGRFARKLPTVLEDNIPSQSEFTTAIELLETTFDCGAHQELIRIDETYGWQFPDDLDRHVKHVYGVYWVNFREVTHCCEFTPSYYLRFIQSCIEYHDYDSIPDAIVEEIEDIIRSNDNHDDSSCYQHCHVVEAIPPEHRHRLNPDGYADGKRLEYDSDEAWQNAVFEEVREWYSGNPVW